MVRGELITLHFYARMRVYGHLFLAKTNHLSCFVRHDTTLEKHYWLGRSLYGLRFIGNLRTVGRSRRLHATPKEVHDTYGEGRAEHRAEEVDDQV